MAFDLDDEELKATRKMYERSDKNVASIDKNVDSIDKAIEILENAIKCNEKQFEELGTHILLQDDEQEAIKIVLANLKILADMQKAANIELENAKKINEEHRKENGELREKVKELEEDLYSANEIIKEYIDSVPKQKIKDKIKELKKQGDYRTIYNSTGRVHFLNESIDYQINVLQELLEDK